MYDACQSDPIGQCIYYSAMPMDRHLFYRKIINCVLYSAQDKGRLSVFFKTIPKGRVRIVKCLL